MRVTVNLFDFKPASTRDIEDHRAATAAAVEEAAQSGGSARKPETW